MQIVVGSFPSPFHKEQQQTVIRGSLTTAPTTMAWSKEKKDLIMTSRVESTEALANAIAACKKPTNFIVASGVGIYGNDFIANENDSLSSCPDESFDVSNTSGFLAEVSRKWEAASQPAVQGGLLKKNRLVNLRIAPVMSKRGGALGKLYPIFFLGGGGGYWFWFQIQLIQNVLDN